MKDKTAFQGYLKQRPPVNRQAVLDALNNPVLTPTIKSEAQLQDIVGKALEKAQVGQASAAQALHAAAAQVNELLAAGGQRRTVRVVRRRSRRATRARLRSQ